jgi:hypothetical protein
MWARVPVRIVTAMSLARRPATLLLVSVLAACAPAPATRSPVATGASPTATALAVLDAPSPAPSSAPSPNDLAAADLDGMWTAPDLAHRLPLAVSIDDSRAARPQSGFNAASIVWQAPADGYESRYLLEFQEISATAIGPVRSARFYLAHWAAELDAAFAHYGGDRLTRGWLDDHRGALFTDVDGIGSGNPAFHRIGTRVAPHNAYTTSAELLRVAVRLGADAAISAGVHLRPFRDDLPRGARGTAQQFAVPYNTVTIRYRYEPLADDYQRYINDNAQVDPMDGERVKARTVVVLFMPFHTDSTIEAGHNRPVLGFIGSGDAWVYSEGTLVKGRWSKTSESAPTLILGSDGNELPLVRGRIFMQVVPLGTKVG